jgi:hypothetical protein
MINHIRTLLLNLPGTTQSRYGEEYVPVDFRPVTRSSALRTVDSILFGRQADRAARNYRLQQFMSLLHYSPLRDLVAELDSRVSYDPTQISTTWDSPLPAVDVGDATKLTVYGEPPTYTQTGGKMDFQWIVRLLDDTPGLFEIEIDGDSTLTVIQPDGWSTPVQLPLSPTFIRISENASTGDSWVLSQLVRPEVDLSEISRIMRQVPEPVQLELFGVGHDEPWESLRNASQSPVDVVALSGFILAYAYRLEERRTRA